jgi:hypothetical protein
VHGQNLITFITKNHKTYPTTLFPYSSMHLKAKAAEVDDLKKLRANEFVRE